MGADGRADREKGTVEGMAQRKDTAQQSPPSLDRWEEETEGNGRQLLRSSDVLLILARYFWILALGLIGGAVGGALATSLMTPTYQASAYLIVVTDSPDVENTAALDYTQAYSKLATVPSVIGPVLREYGIEPTAQDIAEVIVVDVPTNSPVFQITASANDPDVAAGLVNDLGAKLNSFTTDRLAPSSGYRAVVVAEALTPRVPVSPDSVVNTAVGAAGGLFVGGVTALLLDTLLLKRKLRRSRLWPRRK